MIAQNSLYFIPEVYTSELITDIFLPIIDFIVVIVYIVLSNLLWILVIFKDFLR